MSQGLEFRVQDSGLKIMRFGVKGRDSARIILNRRHLALDS